MATSDMSLLAEWQKRAQVARSAAHYILASHEQARSRVVLLEQLFRQISGLPVDVQDYYREALTCLSYRQLRAAVVFSWAGFYSLFSDQLYGSKETAIRAVRPKWHFMDVTELRESVAEAQVLDVAKDVAFIKKADLRIYQGYLATRNQCAHPTVYRPSVNSAIGYVDELIRASSRYI